MTPPGGNVQLVTDPCDSGKTVLAVTGTSGDDTIQIKPADDGKVKVIVNGVTLGSFKPSGHIIVQGQGGNDTITVDSSISIPQILYGNDGNDTIQSGNGASVMIGGSGNDTLKGGNARDIMIGGTGQDTIQGKNRDDILIAGTTSYDSATSANQVSLCAIQSEWIRDVGYRFRIDHLTGAVSGGRNGSNLLKPGQTVFNDADKDTITGGSGKDWFLVNNSGAGTFDIYDRKDDEIATDL